jgi:hypothetical protein
MSQSIRHPPVANRRDLHFALPAGSAKSAVAMARKTLTDTLIQSARAEAREAALAAELEAIRTEKPLHNIVGKVAA